jgi:hypothetical protein
MDLGWKRIAVVQTELTGAEARAFAIADNRTAELAEWHDEGLAAALDGLDDDLKLAAGFNGAEARKLQRDLDRAAGREGDPDDDLKLAAGFNGAEARKLQSSGRGWSARTSSCGTRGDRAWGTITRTPTSSSGSGRRCPPRGP